MIAIHIQNVEAKRAKVVELSISTIRTEPSISAASAEMGLKTTRLPSGAGHDAQMIAKISPIERLAAKAISARRWTNR